MREMTFMDATLEGLTEEMAKDSTIFVVGEGIGKRGGNFNTTTGLYDIYGPERLRDTPICERGFVGMCTGAAMTGARPIVDFMFIDFILDAMGELINQIAKVQYMSNGRVKMPLVLRGCIGVGHAAARTIPAATIRFLFMSLVSAWWYRQRPMTLRGCSRQPFAVMTRCCSWNINPC